MCFFTPPVLLVLISYALSGKYAFTTVGMWIAVTVMVVLGIVICKNKIWGAVAAVVFWAIWGALPYLWQTDTYWKDSVLDMLLTIPMMAMYIAIAVMLFKKNKIK